MTLEEAALLVAEKEVFPDGTVKFTEAEIKILVDYIKSAYLAKKELLSNE